jgi:hypothetical protein
MNLQLLGRPDDQPHGYFCALHRLQRAAPATNSWLRYKRLASLQTSGFATIGA